MFWYCENPNTTSYVPSNSTLVDMTGPDGNWIHNQTCYSLLSVRTYLDEDSVSIATNVAEGCPDIERGYRNRNQTCTSRKVYIYAAIGFLIIRAVGLVLFIYAFAKVY